MKIWVTHQFEAFYNWPWERPCFCIHWQGEITPSTWDFKSKEGKGYELYQLKHLNKLRGTLRIHGLENVSRKEDAIKAELHKKRDLTSVDLSWGRDWNISAQERDLQSEVIEALYPLAMLQALGIRGYEGSSYPGWMMSGGPEVPECLKYLSLSSCSELGRFPENSVLFSNLRTLSISYCDWDYIPDNMEDLKSLMEFNIISCLNINSLPTSMSKLKLLVNLYICKCHCLQSLPTALPQSLRTLEIRDCHGEYFSDIGHLNSIGKLHISNCTNLQSFEAELPQSLTGLIIEICSNLQSLPTVLPQCLQKLTVENCHRFCSLPRMPPSLQYLELGSSNLKFIRSCQTDGHQNYENIRHVPNKKIRYY